jgi:hypothetical protein
MLLFLALVAIILGCLCLWFETQDYGNPPFKGAPQVLLDRDLSAMALVEGSCAPAAHGLDVLVAGRFLERTG